MVQVPAEVDDKVEPDTEHPAVPAVVTAYVTAPVPLPPLVVYEIPPLLDVTLSVVALVILSVDEDPRSSKVFKSKVTVGVKVAL